MRGRIEGPGRILRVRVEALRLGGVDVTGKGGKVLSLCACLGAQSPWAGRDGLPLWGFFSVGCLGRRPKGKLVVKAEGRSPHKFNCNFYCTFAFHSSISPEGCLLF
jgi:hypothetical protein